MVRDLVDEAQDSHIKNLLSLTGLSGEEFFRPIFGARIWQYQHKMRTRHGVIAVCKVEASYMGFFWDIYENDKPFLKPRSKIDEPITLQI